MDEERFDQLSKTLATTVSRRQAVRVLGATAVGGLFAAVGAKGAFARQCRGPGDNCRSNAECCTRFCDTTFHCGCAPGSVLCQEECVPACNPPQVLDPTTCTCGCPPTVVCTAPKIVNPQTCTCVCPPMTTPCGQTACCAPNQVCQNGTCVNAVPCGSQLCPVTQVCCPSFFGTLQCCTPNQTCVAGFGCA